MRKVKNNAGFSLVEIIVAMAMMTITIGGVMMLVSDNTSKNVFKGSILGTSACVTEANRILSAVKEKGALRNRFTMNTATPANVGTQSVMKLSPIVTTSISPTTEVAAQEAGISSAIRWPVGTPVYDLTAAAAPIVRPQSLLMGYMTALQAIYKSDKANFCTAAKGANFYSYDNAGETGTAFNTIFTDPTNLSMDEVKEYVKIEPFDTGTGNIAAGCPDVEPRPPRPNELTLTSDLQHPPNLSATSHPSTATLVAATVPATVRPDRGFLVTATVSFKDRAGRTRDCKSQERFQYNMQSKNSYTLDIQDAENPINDSNPPSQLGGGVYAGFAASGLPTSASTWDNNYSADPPVYLKCNDTSVSPNPNYYSKKLQVRVRYARAGSIMLCRNLSTARPQSSTGTTLNIPVNIRHTFYSTEVMRNAWFTANATDANANGDVPMIAGLYFPTGNYYCLASDGCPGFPFFPLPMASIPGTAADYKQVLNDGKEKDMAANAVVNYYYPLSGKPANLITTATKWAPCERTPVCGVNPTLAHYVGPANGDDEGYHMIYTGLPEGCDVNIQIAEVDAAYNVTATEVRAYMHEKPPGDKVCNSGDGVGVTGHTTPNQWFFACNITPAGIIPGVTCTDANMLSKTPCCNPFPDFPALVTPRAFIDP